MSIQSHEVQAISINKKLLGYFQMLRPKQWTKNLLLFAALIFSGDLFNINLFSEVIGAFFIFCLISGCSYIINDIFDVEEDRFHHKKRFRPIASGLISVKEGISFCIILFLAAIYVSFKSYNLTFTIIILVYFILIFLYSLKLKYVVIMDVMIIAVGFLLRAIAGAVVINREISPWLFVCTILLALFLAINKRKSELLISEKFNEGRTRKVLKSYSHGLLNNMLSIVSSSTIMTYSLYTFSSGYSIYMMVTIPLVLYGLFRYYFLVENSDLGETPEVTLLSDIPLLSTAGLWVLTCVFIIYYL